MLLGKVGNKSIAFINHKPFHPGNLQNLERVWLAEQTAEENEKKQNEMLERRKHEVQIEELRKALREKERQQYNILSNAELEFNKTSNKTKSKRLKKSKQNNGSFINSKESDSNGFNKKCRRNDFDPKVIMPSKYKENILENGHSFIWGSFFDKNTSSWGYSCCKQTKRFSDCSAIVQ